MSVPETFAHKPIPAPLPWHSAQWQRLGTQWQAGRCPHALLLMGSAGLGKRQFADAFSALALCKQPRAGQACGECKDCRLWMAGSHPDFLRVEPEKPGGPLKVEQIRQLGSFVSRTSGRGGVRLVWLSPAESMNINAANALLKNLEEPAASVIFLLVTDAPTGLLPTIKSRCQSIGFPPPAEEMALQWLSNSGLDEQLAQRLLDLAGGAPLLAAELAEPKSRDVREQFFRDLIAVAQATASAVPTAGRWEVPPDNVELAQLLLFWQHWLTQMLHFRSCDVTGDTQIMALLQRIPGEREQSLQSVFVFYDHVLQARKGLKGTTNPNRRLLLEELLIRWAKLFS
ncbi:DNA polymerase III subunit delta' [Microbulbifer sp. OS29]|uniref:DNA polymerase III subunit delta' n=1 Tax=Microbulbifer okhotskensis TaxID=2926617 RepID=A0A9X2ELP9_9GAMM|nr:DNA polymerase III subunit delta' [Microbulbifer okhotskensis]MCO1333986.1 DNA polymerase III subunit delta' [Microbulbifer okhotskensis]